MCSIGGLACTHFHSVHGLGHLGLQGQFASLCGFYCLPAGWTWCFMLEMGEDCVWRDVLEYVTVSLLRSKIKSNLHGIVSGGRLQHFVREHCRSIKSHCSCLTSCAALSNSACSTSVSALSTLVGITGAK